MRAICNQCGLEDGACICAAIGRRAALPPPARPIPTVKIEETCICGVPGCRRYPPSTPLGTPDQRVKADTMNLPAETGEMIEIERAPEHDKPDYPAWREVVSRRIFYFDGRADPRYRPSIPQHT